MTHVILVGKELESRNNCISFSILLIFFFLNAQCCPSLPLHLLHDPLCHQLYRPLDPHSSNHRPFGTFRGAGGYIAADVTVIIRESSLMPGIANMKVYGRLIAL